MFVIMSGGLTDDGQLPDHVIERCEWVIQACNNEYLEKNISIWFNTTLRGYVENPVTMLV